MSADKRMPHMDQHADYPDAVAAWRANRIARLTAEDGWLNLVGLWWLDDGPVAVGAAADCDAVLSSGPAWMGTATLGPDGFVFQPGDPATLPVRIKVDKKAPTRFAIGAFLLEVVVLAGRTALRIRDRNAAARRKFAGIACFPVDPAWRIVADWLPLDEPVHTHVDTVIGMPSAVIISHKARFARDGRAYELLPTHGTPQSPQFVIRDLTSGKTTYAASRFLFGEDITAASIVLDFNKAINPPCAFTDLAICPLPPPGNILPFAVEAGERTWKD